MKIFTYRYVWRLKGSETLNFKIVTDTEKGLLEFEDKLFSIPEIESCGKEYLHEYEVSKIGVFVSLKNLEKEGE